MTTVLYIMFFLLLIFVAIMFHHLNSHIDKIAELEDRIFELEKAQAMPEGEL
jgi:hypothetical protein